MQDTERQNADRTIERLVRERDEAVRRANNAEAAAQLGSACNIAKLVVEHQGAMYSAHLKNADLRRERDMLREALGLLFDSADCGEWPFDETGEWKHPALVKAREALKATEPKA